MEDASPLGQGIEGEQTPRFRWGGLCQLASDSASDQSSVSMEDASPLGQVIEGEQTPDPDGAASAN